MEAISGVNKMLVRRTSQNKLLFIGELQSGARDFKPKMVQYFFFYYYYYFRLIFMHQTF
jgi:hypothetical protein